jgi:mRNA interferase MazF
VYPNEVLVPADVGGLKNDSIVLCQQIRTVDKQRLIKRLGTIEDMQVREKIIDALCFQLDIVE